MRCPGFYLQTEMMQKGTEGAPGLGLHLHPPQEGADSSHGAGCAPGLQDSPFSGGWVTLEQGQATQGRALGTGEEEELSSSYSSTLPTQSWGKKLDNSGLNKKKATKRLCATSCPPHPLL